MWPYRCRAVPCTCCVVLPCACPCGCPCVRAACVHVPVHLYVSRCMSKIMIHGCALNVSEAKTAYFILRSRPPLKFPMLGVVVVWEEKKAKQKASTNPAHHSQASTNPAHHNQAQITPQSIDYGLLNLRQMCVMDLYIYVYINLYIHMYRHVYRHACAISWCMACASSIDANDDTLFIFILVTIGIGIGDRKGRRHEHRQKGL